MGAGDVLRFIFRRGAWRQKNMKGETPKQAEKSEKRQGEAETREERRGRETQKHPENPRALRETREHLGVRGQRGGHLATNGDVEIRYGNTNENVLTSRTSSPSSSRLPRSASTATSSWASARSSARELRLHASCAATSTSRRQAAQSRQLALSGSARV